MSDCVRFWLAERSIPFLRTWMSWLTRLSAFVKQMTRVPETLLKKRNRDSEWALKKQAQAKIVKDKKEENKKEYFKCAVAYV